MCLWIKDQALNAPLSCPLLGILLASALNLVTILLPFKISLNRGLAQKGGGGQVGGKGSEALRLNRSIQTAAAPSPYIPSDPTGTAAEMSIAGNVAAPGQYTCLLGTTTFMLIGIRDFKCRSKLCG